jgi:predicted phage baseplate assembly protein
MTLPTPRLDDRSFQELVDEAKRYVQQRCPEWTDHNVSDPGVTLIETFAWMSEMLIYRLNRVPDRLHLRFLELLGVTLFPPQAARTEVSFRLSSHQATGVRIPAGTAVSTRRSLQEEAIGFTTVRDLEIPPATSTTVAALDAAGHWRDLTAALLVSTPQEVFGHTPQVDDALYIGLDQPASRAIVLCQFVCNVGGHGIDPRTPPLAWEAWTQQGWAKCEVQSDDTRGLNVSGGVELHVPPDHAMSTVSGSSAAWLRCRVVPSARSYRSSPVVLSVSAATVGGDVESMHAERVVGELLGVSDGTTGQRFHASYPPILPDVGSPMEVRVGHAPEPQPGAARATPQSGPQGALQWDTWLAVDDFSHSGPTDRHFVVDRTDGEIRFGPLIRQQDGSARRFGAIPPRGATLRLGEYRTGGGSSGNVAAEAISVLRTSIPYVTSVYNRRAAVGGVEGETVEEARERGPIELRRQSRAVTVEDYVSVTSEAAPELARVHCVPVVDGPDAGAVRVLVVPRAEIRDGRIALTDLRLPESARERVVSALERSRVIGARVSVEPPSYVGVRVDARVMARRDAEAGAVEREATEALFAYFSPLTGGPDGDGWPLGRPVQPGEVHTVLARVAGVDYVEDVVLLRASPLDGAVSEPQDRIDLAATHLVVSVEHNVYVTRRAS